MTTICSVPRAVLLTLTLGSLAACGNPAPGSQPPSDAAPPPAQAAPADTPFDKAVTYDTIAFRVTSPGRAAGNSFTITPSGLSASNEPMSADIAAEQVTGVIADDMDGDNSPEAVVTTRAADGKVKAYVFGTFARRSFGLVNLPEVSDAALLAGYQGGDEYNMIENTFVRRFPIHVNGQPSGKYRQLQYKLKAGEAMKQLVFDRSIEY